MAQAQKPRMALIVDDHYVSALGVEMVLRRHVNSPLDVRTAQNGQTAIAMAAQQTPSLVVVDLMLPDMSGLDVIRKVRAQAPSARILVLTGSADSHLLRQAYLLRVDAILRKTHTDQNMQEALRFLEERKGATYIDPSAQDFLHRTTNQALTRREYEVVGLMAQGLTSGEIAKRMGCSVATVKTYRGRIMNKSGARNSAEIMAWYLKGNGKQSFGA